MNAGSSNIGMHILGLSLSLSPRLGLSLMTYA